MRNFVQLASFVLIFILFFPLLVLFISITTKAYSNSICSTSNYKIDTNNLTLDKQQTEDLQDIYNISSSRHLDINAAVIATETALVESNLENPAGGDNDSVGLLQQRHSQNWKGDLTDPKVQINNFYDHLQKINNWQLQDRWVVAQSIQRSAKPERYKEKDAQAEELSSHIQKIGDDNIQSGKTDISKCGIGSNNNDPGGVCLLSTTNGLDNCTNAINNGLKQISNPTQNWHNKCLAFVATMYGHPFSGYGTALEMWNSIQQHKDGTPPRGALVFWKTGNPAGHVALSLGEGKVITTDMRAVGEASIQSLEDFNTIWHAQYLGWSYPTFK